MKPIRIKRVYNADFRKNAATMYEEIKRNRKLWCGALQPNEAYLFVSMRQNQVLFVLNDHEIKTQEGTRFESRRRLLDYRGWRIDGSIFDEHMLENYANAVGLTLGKKRLEEYWAARYPTA